MQQVVAAGDIDIAPAFCPIRLQILIPGAVPVDLDARAVSVGDALAVAPMQFEAVAVVVTGVRDRFGMQEKPDGKDVLR